MAFGLTSFVAYGQEAYEGLTKQFKQTVVIKATGTAADVALDIGNTGGTFWGDVDATTEGASAEAAFGEILAKANVVISELCPEIEDAKVRIATSGTLAAGQYKKVSAKGTTLGYTLLATEGLASYTIVLEFSLLPGVLPTQATITA